MMQQDLVVAPQDLIVVRQLPIIEEKLRQIKQNIQTQVASALDMECTENTYKEVKRVRSELGKGFQDLESRRKEVKRMMLAPYDAFEEVYKECVTNVFKPADTQLKDKIDEVERGLKEQKGAEVVAYFNEYRDSRNIDFVDFSRSGIVVSMAASKKSLKEQAKAFIDKIADELDLIAIQEHREEILVEYKQSLNVAQSITKVNARHQAIEEERAKAECSRRHTAEQAAAAQKVEAVIQQEAEPPALESTMPPATVPSESAAPENNVTVYEVKFWARGTYDEIKALSSFLKEGRYDYGKL